MAFEELAGGKNMSPGTKPNEVTVTFSAKRHSTAGALLINVGPEVSRKLGWVPGVTKVKVLEGSGPDVGNIQISSSKTGITHTLSVSGKESNVGRISVSVTKFRHHRFPEESISANPVEVAAFGGQILIEMPKWFAPIKE